MGVIVDRSNEYHFELCTRMLHQIRTRGSLASAFDNNEPRNMVDVYTTRLHSMFEDIYSQDVEHPESDDDDWLMSSTPMSSSVGNFNLHMHAPDDDSD